MQAYGHKRHDMLSCKYGCCGRKGHQAKFENNGERVDRAARKRARRDGKRQIEQAVQAMYEA